MCLEKFRDPFHELLSWLTALKANLAEVSTKLVDLFGSFKKEITFLPLQFPPGFWSKSLYHSSSRPHFPFSKTGIRFLSGTHIPQGRGAFPCLHD